MKRVFVSFQEDCRPSLSSLALDRSLSPGEQKSFSTFSNQIDDDGRWKSQSSRKNTGKWEAVFRGCCTLPGNGGKSRESTIVNSCRDTRFNQNFIIYSRYFLNCPSSSEHGFHVIMFALRQQRAQRTVVKIAPERLEFSVFAAFIKWRFYRRSLSERAEMRSERGHYTNATEL